MIGVEAYYVSKWLWGGKENLLVSQLYLLRHQIDRTEENRKLHFSFDSHTKHVTWFFVGQQKWHYTGGKKYFAYRCLHSNTTVSTFALQQEDPGFLFQPGISAWSLHMLSMLVWFPFGLSSFLPMSKTMSFSNQIFLYCHCFLCHGCYSMFSLALV